MANYIYLEDLSGKLKLESGDFYLLENANVVAEAYDGPRTSRADEIRQTRDGDTRIPRGYFPSGDAAPAINITETLSFAEALD
jgi:hypothetical protein